MIKSYKEAITLLYSYIGKNDKVWNFWNQRLKYFLNLLQNPELSFQTIHIAWTSWKWSTAYTTSQILKTHWYRVWLHVSPHLLDIRERFQINNSLVSKKDIIQIINKMIPAIKECHNSFFGPPTYYEITLGLAFIIFKQNNIDIAIVEAWCGGLLDWTNNCNPKNKICVITKQWFDHEHILGNTLEEITFNDAGIIKPDNIIVTLKHKQNISNKIIEFYSKINNSQLHTINWADDYQITMTDKNTTKFNYKNKNKKRINLETNLLWEYQIENISLALKTCEIFLTQKRKKLNWEVTNNCIKKIERHWRFEKFKIWKKTIIIDGAHNPQKMEAFTSNLKKLYPNQNFIFLVAIKWKNKYWKILDPIIKITKNILITQFKLSQDFFLTSLQKEDYKKYFSTKNFKHRKFEKDPEIWLKTILKQTSSEIIVITGSLYLLSIIYPILKDIQHKSH